MKEKCVSLQRVITSGNINPMLNCNDALITYSIVAFMLDLFDAFYQMLMISNAAIDPVCEKVMQPKKGLCSNHFSQKYSSK
jgi:hypothetical protein